MKRIIPRVIVMLSGLLVFAIGIIHNLLVPMGAGILMSVFALINTIEAELYNRARWDRLVRYYIKERDARTESEMHVELADYELEEFKKKITAAEATPNMIYVGGFKNLTDALNQAHGRNMLKTAGREINE